MNEPISKASEPQTVEALAAEYVKAFLATGMAYEFTAESIATRSFIDGYTAGSREVGQLKAALALGQENCDAEYDQLREERDEARAELASVEAADASARIEGEAEIARLVGEVAGLRADIADITEIWGHEITDYLKARRDEGRSQ